VGPYQLVTEIDRGALGPLWAARVASGVEEGRVVTLRRISTAVTTPAQSQRLVEAARIAGNLRHSKLAAVLDVVATEHEIVSVGEHVDGATLALLQRLAYVNRSPVPPPVALRIAVDILHGIRAAREGWHQHAPPALRTALNGGLFPDNVFIAAFGDVLLGDIGVSGVAASLEPFRRVPAIAAYRAPEQLFSGAEFTPDERVDVFSVGVVLWELLANRPLFGDAERLRASAATGGADAAARTVHDVQSKLIPALGERGREGAPLSRAALDVVERALRRDPATRYATIDQMLGGLLALGRNGVASNDQVAVAVDHLARAEINAQRVALGGTFSLSSSSRPSAAPDSGRPSYAPKAPGVREDFSKFSKHEAPTVPTAELARRALASLPPLKRSTPPPPPPTRSIARASAPPPPVRSVAPASSTPPPPPVRGVAPASSAPPPPRRNPPVASPVVPAFGDALPPLPDLPEVPKASSAPTPPIGSPIELQPVPVRPGAPRSRVLRARRIALIIGGLIALIGLLGVLSALLRSGPAEDDAPAPQPSRSIAGSLPEVARPVDRSPAPVAPPPPTSGTARETAHPARGGPKTKPPREERSRPEPRQEGEKKPFRPRGI
jgi:eukaryotic-like serine/threonine-protein kinase